MDCCVLYGTVQHSRDDSLLRFRVLVEFVRCLVDSDDDGIRYLCLSSNWRKPS